MKLLHWVPSHPAEPCRKALLKSQKNWRSISPQISLFRKQEPQQRRPFWTPNYFLIKSKQKSMFCDTGLLKDLTCCKVPTQSILLGMSSVPGLLLAKHLFSIFSPFCFFSWSGKPFPPPLPLIWCFPYKENRDANVSLAAYFQNEVNAIKWDPTGNLLASCSDDMTLKVKVHCRIGWFWTPIAKSLEKQLPPIHPRRFNLYFGIYLIALW